MSFSLHPVDGGVDLRVTGRWTDKAAACIRSGEADGLQLNYAWGFSEPDLRFLIDLPIVRLFVIDRSLDDLSPLYSLGELQELTIQSEPRAELDLRNLPDLRTLGASWEQVRTSIASVSGIEDLYLGSYTEDDLTPLAHLVALERLVFKDYPRIRSLAGVQHFSRLRHLSVQGARQLESLDALAELTSPQLETLQLSYCKRAIGLSVVEQFAELRFLEFSEAGEVPTLSFIRSLQKLEWLHIYGSTRVADGDLSPVAALPRLTDFRMQNRRHYAPSVNDVKELIASRNP